jgi:hypothetical protein
VILQTAAIAGFPPAMIAMSTLKTILAGLDGGAWNVRSSPHVEQGSPVRVERFGKFVRREAVPGPELHHHDRRQDQPRPDPSERRERLRVTRRRKTRRTPARSTG